MSSSPTSSSRRSTSPPYSGPVDAVAASCSYDSPTPTSPPSCVNVDPEARAHDAVIVLLSHSIDVVEWADLLSRRVGAPAWVKHISFLVTDGQLETACHIVADDCHLPQVGSHPLQVFQLGDLHAKAQHFDITPDLDPEHPQSRRLSLFPLSWAGFVDDELRPTPLRLSRWRPSALDVLTVSPASFCASLVRLHGRAWRGSAMATTIECDLATILYHSLFDTSYEGDYMELKGNEPLTEEEQEEMTGALDKFRSWHFRDEEFWIADALEAILAGRGYYKHLPSLAISK